jgi:hypothetical protein
MSARTANQGTARTEHFIGWNLLEGLIAVGAGVVAGIIRYAR